MGQGKFPTVKWEDEDSDFESDSAFKGGATPDDAGSEESEDFAQLLDRDDADEERQSLRVGQKVKGKVLRVNPTTGEVMVDLGVKNLGIIERREMATDPASVPVVKVGDMVEAYVVSRRGSEVILSDRMSTSLRSVEDLEAAQAQKIPVRGRVSGAVKGGVEVSIMGKTAFCPMSQLDTKFLENAADYVGQELEFLVERVESRGRNIVLSRAALLRARAEERMRDLMANLEPDQILDGKVTDLRDFGAFVDIGGVEGLVHVSELSHARVSRVADFIDKGAAVRVKVLKVERDAQGRPKISLSMKAASQDPWDQIYSHVATGETYSGRVVNVMPFGAFVEVKPGIEGLLHISEMSWTKRVHHPSEVVKVGDQVTVKVKDIDPVQKRLGLTMKNADEDPWLKAKAILAGGVVVTGTVERLKPFGALVTVVEGVSGLIPMALLKKKFGEAYRTACSPGRAIEVKATSIDDEGRKVQLGLTGVDEDEDSHEHYLEYLKAEEAAKAREKSEPKAPSAEARMGTLGALLSAKLQGKK